MSYRGGPQTLPERVAWLEEQLRNMLSKQAATAVVAGNAATSPGPTGPQGPQGIQGQAGPTGPAGAAATVEAYDEGVLLGTWDTVDFVGDAITATLIGTDLTVTLSDSGCPCIPVELLADEVFTVPDNAQMLAAVAPIMGAGATIELGVGSVFATLGGV